MPSLLRLKYQALYKGAEASSVAHGASTPWTRGHLEGVGVKQAPDAKSLGLVVKEIRPLLVRTGGRGHGLVASVYNRKLQHRG